MTHMVTDANGEVHIFPDEATPQMMTQALGLQQDAPQNAPQITAGERFQQGFIDQANGLAQAGLHVAQYLPDSVLPDGARGADKFIDNQLAADESTYQAKRTASGNEGVDWMRLLGGTAATLPLSAAIPEVQGAKFAAAFGKVAKPAATAANISLQGIAGGAYGGMQPVTSGDFDEEKQNQMLTGAGFGSASVPIGNMLGKLIKPEISKNIQSLMDEGVTPSVGQILGGGSQWLENKATSIPGVGYMINKARSRSLDQFNTAALNRALQPIGSSTDKIGREGIVDVSTKLSDAYDQLLPKVQFVPDVDFGTAVASARAKLPESQAKEFDRIIGNEQSKFKGQNVVDGETLKGIQSQLRKDASGYSSDASYNNRLLGESIDDVHAAIGDNLVKSNPQYANELSDINRGYANYSVLRRAGSMVKEDGPFTPSQLANAIRSNDKSVGKGNFAKGQAIMQDLSDAGNAVLPNKYPDSGTAGREGMAALIGGALLGHVNPLIPTAIGAGALPYTPWGQKTAAFLAAGAPQTRDQMLKIGQQISPAFSNALSIYGTQVAQ